MSEESSLAIYLREIGKNRNLAPSEEAEVAVRIHNGEKAALEKGESAQALAAIWAHDLSLY